MSCFSAIWTGGDTRYAVATLPLSAEGSLAPASSRGRGVLHRRSSTSSVASRAAREFVMRVAQVRPAPVTTPRHRFGPSICGQSPIFSSRGTPPFSRFTPPYAPRRFHVQDELQMVCFAPGRRTRAAAASTSESNARAAGPNQGWP